MKLTRVALMFAACLTATAVEAPPALAQPQCAVAGRYAVIGRVPGGTDSYTGEAVISAAKQGCEVRWFPPNDSSGTGTYRDGVLTIRFTFANGSGSGVVRYAQARNGELHGVWWMDGNEANQGTETLRPL